MRHHDTDEEFEAFVRVNFARLCRSGYLLCGDWQRTEDATQEALLKVHRHWRSIREPEAYARRAVTTILIDLSRRPWRRETVQDELRDSTGAHPQARVDDRDEVVRALLRLTPRGRACIVLRYYLEASVSETTEVLR